MINELMTRITKNCEENGHGLTADQQTSIIDVLMMFSIRFEQMENTLQVIANCTAQDYPPSEQLKSITQELSDINFSPQKLDRATLRNWPDGTEWR
jgi:hypothetical protein